jgi:hypothetical protein
MYGGSADFVFAGPSKNMSISPMVFLNLDSLPLPRNALKKKVKKKKSDGGWVGLGFSKCTGGVRRFVFAGPSRLRHGTCDSNRASPRCNISVL